MTLSKQEQETYDRMGPLVLTGDQKEIYLRNFIGSLETLSQKVSGIDKKIPEFLQGVARGLSFLQYIDGEEDPTDNRGIYEEITLDKKFGVPTLENLIIFAHENRGASDTLKQLPSKVKIGQKVKEVLLDYTHNQEAQQELVTANSHIRQRNHYTAILETDYLSLHDGANTSWDVIELLSENKEVEKFNIFKAGWDLGKRFFSIYSMQLDDDKDKVMIIGTDKPGHIFLEHNTWKPSDELTKILQNSFGSHPKFYFNATNQLEGIHPREITYFAIDSFETAHVNNHFSDMLKRNPDSSVLVATSITLHGQEEEGKGKKRQTKIDMHKDATTNMYIVCSEQIKSNVAEFYEHNKYVNFKIFTL